MPRFADTHAMSLDALQRLINDRRRELQKLERQRAKWQRKVDAVDRRIAAIGGSNGRHRGPGVRARNDMSLADAIAEVLSRTSSAVGVGDIIEKVQATGYRSGSANFRGIVNQALIKDRRFVAEERGMYRLRGSVKTKARSFVRKARTQRNRRSRRAASGNAEAPVTSDS